jgi:glycosyltransferase involved in cell wall biosynthesis
MKILFIHQNFPAQFNYLAQYLASDPKYTVVALRQPPQIDDIPGVRVIAYDYLHRPAPVIHPLLSEIEAKLIRAEAVVEAARQLRNQGFNPDVVVVHPGWGEALLIKDVWPKAKYLGYFEYFYSATGQEFDFDPEFASEDLESLSRLRLKNHVNFHALHDMDAGITPTRWQKNTYPEWARGKIDVIHEGIDTQYFCPSAKQTLTIKNKDVKLTSRDEVITYAARYLEPVRGFHCFMRALPGLLERRPNAHVVIMGGEEPGYGPAPEHFPTYKAMMLDELGDQLDPNRVHFLGRLPKAVYRSILQISRVHVYLTYPFFLSWSMLEAMASGPIIVASDTAPVRELITDGENGLLFDFFSAEALIERVDQALKMPHRQAVALRKASRATIEKEYDFQACLDALKNRVEALVAPDAAVVLAAGAENVAPIKSETAEPEEALAVPELGKPSVVPPSSPAKATSRRKKAG